MKALTKTKRAELNRLAPKPIRAINVSNTPGFGKVPSDATTESFYRPQKQLVTLRLDSDVLAWLKASGDGYQTRVNTYLRKLMSKQRAS